MGDNTIRIFNEQVILLDDEINAVELGLFLCEVELLDEKFERENGCATCPFLSEDPMRYLTWWFLVEAIRFHPKFTVIRFGHGRSAHTWKSFSGVINYVLKPFMLKEKKHEFLIKEHGRPGWKSYQVVLGSINQISNGIDGG